MSALLQTGLLVDVNIRSLQWEVSYNPKKYCYKNQRVDTNTFWASFFNTFFPSIKFTWILSYPAQT